ncbi:hypothetical protein [Actinoplanes flavus]|uniref:DUF2147 domain-containing protein n=1 Tax=Actinoplanes flavus TaxID=2820290 RepID=A0ABS3UTP4_9ACTN|nr:hypothetical protein [Actinoplanes flavus]MBO3741945.1 hypothetical protein [Actinoplanes flavus]
MKGQQVVAAAPRRKAVRSRPRGYAARFVSYAAVLVILSGCGMCEALADYGDRVDLRHASVVGAWSSDPGRTFTFADDGTFTATHLPIEVVGRFVPDKFDHRREDIDGAGSWRITTPSEDPRGAQSEIHLKFRRIADGEVDTSGPDLTALRQDDGVTRLYFFYSGGWFAYRK